MRGANKNPDLKDYAEWSHRAPYIGISCVVGGIESELATGRPVGDSRNFKSQGDTSTFLKWNLGSIVEFYGDKRHSSCSCAPTASGSQTKQQVLEQK